MNSFKFTFPILDYLLLSRAIFAINTWRFVLFFRQMTDVSVNVLKKCKIRFFVLGFPKKLRGLDSAQNCSLKHLLKKQLVFYLKKSPITLRQVFSYHQMTDISVSVNVLLLYRRSFSRSAFPIIHNRCRWQCLAIEIVICRCWSCWVSIKKRQEVRIYT